VPIVEVVKTATPAAGEFLEVCAVFGAVVGLGFHGGEWGIDRTYQPPNKVEYYGDVMLKEGDW
jgi:hypothetical protein